MNSPNVLMRVWHIGISLCMKASLNDHCLMRCHRLFLQEPFDEILLVDPIEFLSIKKSARNADPFRIESRG